MSQLAEAVLTALAALGLQESDHFASAVRGEVVTIVTAAGQKRVYDPNTPPEAASPGVATKEGVGASASAPTAVPPNPCEERAAQPGTDDAGEGAAVSASSPAEALLDSTPAEGQVEGVVTAAGEASASPVASPAAPEAALVTSAAKAKKPAPAGGTAKTGGAK